MTNPAKLTDEERAQAALRTFKQEQEMWPDTAEEWRRAHLAVGGFGTYTGAAHRTQEARGIQAMNPKGFALIFDHCLAIQGHAE